jgi:hypothetical protein
VKISLHRTKLGLDQPATALDGAVLGVLGDALVQRDQTHETPHFTLLHRSVSLMAPTAIQRFHGIFAMTELGVLVPDRDPARTTDDGDAVPVY